MPTALITGITGQDGSYPAEFLLSQGYLVVGMSHRTSTLNFERIAHFQAEELIAVPCVRQDIQPGQLTIHADRGSSMSSKPVALLMAALGVTKTHSRPHVSNDNPFSEAQFTPALAGDARVSRTMPGRR